MFALSMLDRGPRHSLRGQLYVLAGQKQKRLEQEGREEEARQRTLARESEWISASPRARQAKSKARYQRYEELLQKAAEKTSQERQIVIRCRAAGAERRRFRSTSPRRSATIC